MSRHPRTQRHKPPEPSRWLLLFKVIIAIGQVVTFVKHFFRD
jgi:hypothetical protein